MKKRLAFPCLLILMALYRGLVSDPLGVDVYLLYLPGLASFPLLGGSLFFALRDRSRTSLAALAVSMVVFAVWLQPLRWHSQGTGPYSVVTLNVQGYDTKLNLATKRLRNLQPDFVCFQEVWTRKQLHQVSRVLPGYQFFGNPDDDSVDTHFLWGTFVAVAPGWELRRLGGPDQTAGVLAVKGTQRLIIFSYHGLKTHGYGVFSMLSTAERQRRQAGELKGLCGAYPGVPVLVCGDFNASSAGPALKLLGMTDAFRVRGRGMGLTFPSVFPLADLDRVLGRGVRFESFRTLDAGSDHLAVVATFDFKE